MELLSFKILLEFLILSPSTTNSSLFEGSYTHLQTNLSITPFCDYVNSNALFCCFPFHYHMHVFAATLYDKIMKQN